jgi:uncharacterized protein with WD repeat
LTKGVLEVFKLEDIQDDTSPEASSSLNNVVNFEVADIDDTQLQEIVLVCGRVLTDEKSKKKKSVVAFYKLSDLSKPVKEMSVSATDRMKIKLNPDRKTVLINSISDDTSTSSYYGESTLYFMDLLYGKFQKLSLPSGPIHDFTWTTSG